VKPLNLKNFNQSFNTKNVKYGGYATLLFLFMVVILIVVNLVAEQLPFKFDLSENKLFSLSQQTAAVMKKVQDEITIYALYPAGKEHKSIIEVLKKYQELSKKVTLKTLDPNKNPGFIKKFSTDGDTPGEGSLIIISGKYHKVIPGYELFNYYTNEETQEQEIVSLAIEQQVTNAVLYVTTGKGAAVIYQVQGHGEDSLPYDLERQLHTENYNLKGLTLATQSVPKDAALLMVYAPKQDFTVEETEKVRQYLANQGRAIFLIDYIDQKLTNLNSILNSYGIDLEQQLVVEGDPSHHVGNPLMILPQYSSHPILQPLGTNQMPVLVPAAQSLKLVELRKQSLNIEPLLVTTEQAWAKKDSTSLNQAKSADDPQGPFTLAVAVTDGTESQNNSKLVVVANAQFINAQYSAQVPGNVSLLTSSLNWLQNQKNNLSIQPKSLLTYRLRLNAMQTIIYSALVILVIPFGILITGLMVWLRRRHL